MKDHAGRHLVDGLPAEIEVTVVEDGTGQEAESKDGDVLPEICNDTVEMKGMRGELPPFVARIISFWITSVAHGFFFSISHRQTGTVISSEFSEVFSVF